MYGDIGKLTLEGIRARQCWRSQRVLSATAANTSLYLHNSSDDTTRFRSRLIQVAYVTSLGCLCLKPASFEIFGCNYVCIYVCTSLHLPRFQVWPSKSRLFCSQSIDSERKQKNIQNTNKV